MLRDSTLFHLVRYAKHFPLQMKKTSRILLTAEDIVKYLGHRKNYELAVRIESIFHGVILEHLL